MRELIDRYARDITERLNGNLDALILVGSHARGEGIEGLSDIEFWAVVKDLGDAKKPHLDKNVYLGFTTRDRLTKLRPYIYTVEVRKFGKVLHGDKNIVSSIPDYSFEDIALVDGFRLLNNRIVEQLILLNRIENGEVVNQYDFDKGYIQLVNSILVLNGRYRSLYAEKLEEFRKLDKIDPGLRKKADEAFVSIKLVPLPEIDRDRALEKWLELREYFRMIWSKEKKLFSDLLNRPMRFWVYYMASRLYFSDKYQDRHKRDGIIRMWERFIR